MYIYIYNSISNIYLYLHTINWVIHPPNTQIFCTFSAEFPWIFRRVCLRHSPFRVRRPTNDPYLDVVFIHRAASTGMGP